jgi:hypothetical protein
MTDRTPVLSPRRLKLKFQRLLKKFFIGPQPRNFMGNPIFSICCPQKVELDLACRDSTTTKRYYVETTHWPMSSERDSFAKGIFSTFAKGFLLHKLLLKVNYSPLRVKKSRSHDMGQ